MSLHIKKFFNLFLAVSIFMQSVIIAAPNTDIVFREKIYLDDINTSSVDANLSYYKYYDNLPEEISIELFKDLDLTKYADKKLFVGYGSIDDIGDDCRHFPKEVTGYEKDTTICLPYWRIEREYIREVGKIDDLPSVVKMLPKPKPPLRVDICDRYSDGKVYPGGKVACVSYFDKLGPGNCFNVPKQSACFVTTCTEGIKKNCTFFDTVIGEVTELEGASTISSEIAPTSDMTRVELTTSQYTCPAGPIAENVNCTDMKQVMMYPAKCEDDDLSTPEDDSVWEYCEKENNIRDNDNQVISFYGTCKNGNKIVCESKSFKNEQFTCVEPIFEEIEEIEIKEHIVTKSSQDFEIDWLSGEPDIYSEKDNCLRINNIEDSRDKPIFIDIQASGSLDDDVYILKHRNDGSISKIYCNMQHPFGGNPKKSYNGEILSCLKNNGSYSVDKKAIPIDYSDVLTIQQNSENEGLTSTPFAIGRNHYGSTKVTLNQRIVTPEVTTQSFPYYPHNGPWLRTWDNVTSTFTILFPFSGIYDLYFYNSNGDEILKKRINPSNFREIADSGYSQLFLAGNMKLAPGFEETDSLGLEDNWVEIGGGVFGGRNSKNGSTVKSPNDAYVKSNAITSIIVKDLLLNRITPIKMVYPLAYPNRIFLSKLQVYEKRQYRCYNDFDVIDNPGTVETKYVCSNNQAWKDYKNDNSVDTKDVPFWISEPLCKQNCQVQGVCSKVGNTEENICDINGKSFQNVSDCESNCFVQDLCDAHTSSNCVLTQEDLFNPVSDFTGKTVFTSGQRTYSCSDKKHQYVGCSKWESKILTNEMDFNFDGIGVERLNPVPFEDAITKANMLGMPMHVFGGWMGECRRGMKMDASYLSNPMTIASYAMAAYAAYGQYSQIGEGAGGTGSTQLQSEYPDYTNKITENYDTATESFTGTYNTDDLSVFEQTEKFYDDAVSFADDDFVSWDGYETITDGSITNGEIMGFGINTALVLLAPATEDYEVAQDIINGYTGQSTSDTVVKYNICMASIGLSMPNMVSWSFADSNTTSPQLKEPYKNPLVMTATQLATLSSVYGENYVMRNYRINGDDPQHLLIIARNQNSYIEAGKTLCAGAKVAVAINQTIQRDMPEPSSNATSMAVQIALKALMMINPIIGFVAMVVMDLYTNMLAKMDACNDEADAMAESPLAHKTYMFKSFEQCHEVSVSCTKKLFSKCVQHRETKCCYDSILTRVFAEGLKEQLGKGWTSCNDITINDLKDISFQPCAENEQAQRDKCFPLGKYSEFKQVLFRQASKSIQGIGTTETLMGQVKEAIVVPE